MHGVLGHEGLGFVERFGLDQDVAGDGGRNRYREGRVLKGEAICQSGATLQVMVADEQLNVGGPLFRRAAAMIEH